MPDSGKYIVEALREELQKTTAAAVVNTWFSDAQVISMSDGVLKLYSPAEFKRKMISSRYKPALRDAVRNIYGITCEIDVLDELPDHQDSGEHIDFSFDSFIEGESNKFAAAAARAVAKSPGTAYNPLFIYGGSGLGKTHLLYAIRNTVRASNPDIVIRDFTAEQFTNELVLAIQEKKTAEFREKYREAKLLLVDDIQFIAGKEFAQDEFFHTFNALYDDRQQIVLTSDRPPRDLQKLEERLRTRFEWGLTVDIKKPDYETRMAIVRSKASQLGMILPSDVIEYIANTVTANVRQLEGTVKKLMAYRDLMATTIDIISAQQAIADLMRESPGINPTPQLIIHEICAFYRVEEHQLLGKSRQAEIVAARQAAMYLIRNMTGMSLEQIGDRVFSRDHTTVLHSVRKIEEQIRTDPAYDNEIKIIMENIRGC